MIVRGPRPADAFALIHREALADGRLSFKARGILAYLLALPDGAEISPERITKSGTDGERAVKSGLKELQDAGYLLRTEAGWAVTDQLGVGTPTPTIETVPVDGAEHLLWLTKQHTWLSPQAVRTAHREIELQDLPLSITKYEIRMVELNKKPSSGEWLRWLIEDEQKMRLAERDRAREAGTHKPWYATA
jgi:hypothetical protein